MNKEKNTLPPNQDTVNAPLTNKKQWLFMVLFVGIAVISVVTVVSQSKEFSLTDFTAYIKDASIPGLIVALLSMLGFIVFEGIALLILCRAFGHKRSFWQGYIYSTSDIYFSAITPSATGGQPASAYFMIKDGMSGMMVTALLLANLCMYTLSIIAIGLVCFIFRFDLFLQYSLLSKLLIIVGFLMQIGLLLFFYMLLKKDHLLQRICNWCFNLLCKLHLLRNREKKQAKLDAYMERYRQNARLLTGHTKSLFFCFIFNFLQRASQIAVTLFVYMATTGQSILQSIDLWFWQGYVVLGSNCIPIPGAMGVSDYMMLDGFRNIMTESQAVNLELLSRSFSFYSCVIICGISTLVQYCIIKRRGKK